jgi:hypothetical protein
MRVNDLVPIIWIYNHQKANFRYRANKLNTIEDKLKLDGACGEVKSGKTIASRASCTVSYLRSWKLPQGEVGSPRGISYQNGVPSRGELAGVRRLLLSLSPPMLLMLLHPAHLLERRTRFAIVLSASTTHTLQSQKSCKTGSFRHSRQGAHTSRARILLPRNWWEEWTSSLLRYVIARMSFPPCRKLSSENRNMTTNTEATTYINHTTLCCVERASADYFCPSQSATLTLWALSVPIDC